MAYAVATVLERPSLASPSQALDELLSLRQRTSTPTYLAALESVYRDEVLRRNPDDVPAAAYMRWVRSLLKGLLTVSEPVLWRDAIWDLASQAVESYPFERATWSPEMLLSPFQHWTFQSDIVLSPDSQARMPGFTHAWGLTLGLLTPATLRLLAGERAAFDVDDRVLFGPSGKGRLIVISWMIWEGRFHVPIFNFVGIGDRVTEDTKGIGGRLDFLRSRVVEQATERADRGARRRWERSTESDPPSVRVITLRRSHREAAEASGNPVEWKHRWIVRGHWRDQRVGEGRAEIRPTFIAPHIKGPDHLPLLPQAERIFVATR